MMSLWAGEPGDERWNAAPCRKSDDPDALWFASRGVPAERAALLCREQCPVALRDACLSAGMHPDNIGDGVWGGLTAQQRRALARGQEVTPHAA